jgi:hypothetical protein
MFELLRSFKPKYLPVLQIQARMSRHRKVCSFTNAHWHAAIQWRAVAMVHVM